MPALEAILDDRHRGEFPSLSRGEGCGDPSFSVDDSATCRVAVAAALLLLRLLCTISFSAAAMGLPEPRGDGYCTLGDNWILGDDILRRGPWT